MLWTQLQRILRLFMITALVVGTIPHSHASVNLESVAQATATQADHDGHTHDHDAPTDHSTANHHHAPAADHVHEKPFPAEALSLRPVTAHAVWRTLPGDEQPDAETGRLERPPRA